MQTTNWTIPELLQLSGGYWGACALHAGVKLDIFTPLAGRELTAPEVAAACSTDSRGTAMLLDALSAMHLLEKSAAGYRCTPFAAKALSRSSPGYLGHIIMHHHHLMASWALLPEAVRSGVPQRDRVSLSDDSQIRESFLMGMFNLASQLAPSIAQQLDLQGRRRLLDLGGGPGTYAIHFCRQYPQLSAVVYDLPTTRAFAERTIASFDLEDRIAFAAGDFQADTVPEGFDVAWLSHILHGEGPDGCATILRKGVEALEPGGMLYVQEFILDNAKDGPLFPALFSMNMLVNTVDGRSYSEQELSEMMAAAGLRDIYRLPGQLPNGAGIMAGTRQ